MGQSKFALNPHRRLLPGLFIFAWIALLYTLPNHFLLRPAQKVPLTIFDTFIDFSSNWIWIYISYYFYLITSYFYLKNEKNLTCLAYSFVIAALLSSVIFFLFPTYLPRDLYAIQQTKLSDLMLNFIRSIDTSLNCAPSMHIAMTTIACACLMKEASRFKTIFLLWAFLIAYSTMATKQHYFIDVASGFILGILIFIFSSKIANN